MKYLLALQFSVVVFLWNTVWSGPNEYVICGLILVCRYFAVVIFIDWLKNVKEYLK